MTDVVDPALQARREALARRIEALSHYLKHLLMRAYTPASLAELDAHVRHAEEAMRVMGDGTEAPPPTG